MRTVSLWGRQTRRRWHGSGRITRGRAFFCPRSARDSKEGRRARFRRRASTWITYSANRKARFWHLAKECRRGYGYAPGPIVTTLNRCSRKKKRGIMSHSSFVVHRVVFKRRRTRTLFLEFEIAISRLIGIPPDKFKQELCFRLLIGW